VSAGGGTANASKTDGLRGLRVTRFLLRLPRTPFAFGKLSGQIETAKTGTQNPNRKNKTGYANIT
jgi:hypothetical protein